MENSAEFYYEKLKNADMPGVILASFYCTQYNVPVSKSETIMFNKLVKTYGRFIVFFTILDVTGTYQAKPENPYALLATICKRRFETVHTDSTLQARESLDKYIAGLEEEMEKQKRRKIKTPSSKGLE